MKQPSHEELGQAHSAIQSLVQKCERSLEKLKDSPMTPQKSLLRNRIKALKIAIALLEKERSGKH